MAAVGLTPEDVQIEEIAVWPDNWQALTVFSALGTQWRTGGMGGLIGLDYGVIPPTLELMGVAREDWAGLFEALRVMEQAALEAVNAP